MFFQMTKMLVVSSKRLILVFCLLLSVISTYADSDNYAYVEAKIHPSSPALGKVYASGSEQNQETDTKDGVATGIGNIYAQGTQNVSLTISADAINKTHKSYFEGWTQDPSALTSLDVANPKSLTVSTSADNSPGTSGGTWYAVFQPIIKTPKQAKFIVYDDGMDIVTVSLQNIYKRQSLTLELVGSDASKFLLSKDNTTWTSNLSFGSEAGLAADKTVEKLDVYVTYSDGEYDSQKALQVGDDTYLKITDNENLVWQIPIVVTEPETFTFLAGEGGKYTVIFADANNTKIVDITEDQEPVDLRKDMYTFSLNATANTSTHKFFGWQTVDETGVGTYFSYDSQVLDKTFEGGTKIRPVFIPKDQAIFIIKEDVLKTPYCDLQEALDVAQNKGYSTVVFNAPTKGTKGTLFPRSNGEAYIIPSGVTLLVPGDAAYTCRTKYSSDLPDTDFPAATSSANFSKLILADNTKITLQGGNLCVYSTISSSMGYNGTPVSYGWIEMGENCEIATTASQKSYLYVLGYITGPSSLSSSVQLNEGSIAYEAFQMPDFRGGGALSPSLLGGQGVASNNKGVFPSEQYYIQNMEVPLKIKSGATLKGMMPANISKIGIVKGDLDIVAQNSGLIQLTNEVELMKYYDSQRDVQVYHVIGKGSTQSSAKIGNVKVNITGISMDTKDFVLPITSNMEIILDNVTISSQNRVGMLAGSKIWIKENAIMNQNAQLYVYDKNENKLLPNPEGYTGNGYFGSTNAELVLIKHTPNKTHLNKRTVANLTSAQLRVDGQLNIAGNGIYTTASGADIVSFADGAQINVAASFKTAAQKEVLYRLKQKGSEAVQYPTLAINPAWLKNSDGTYVQTTGDAVAYQYYATAYDSNGNVTAGIWSLPPAKVTADSWNGTTVTATMPNQVYLMTITCLVENVTADNFKTAFTGSLDGTGFTFAGTDSKFENSISLNGNTLSIAVNYTPQNNTSTQHTTTLTLINATVPTAEYTFSTRLTATEVYSPEFSIDKSDITLQTLNNSMELNNAFTITPAANNVATLGAADGLVWSYEILNKDDDNENTLFGYTQGSLTDGTIANNTVTFTANTTGTQYARLVITATYTPEEGVTRSSEPKTINLIGTKLIENTLAFDMPTDIWVTDKNIPVAFSGRNNTGSIVVTLTTNGEDGSPVVELREDAGTYYINALRAGSFTMQASQMDNGGVAGTTKTCTINVNKLTPNPTWKWGTVYGNQTYSTPFDPATVLDGKWTLVESSDSTNALAYDEATHTIQVMNVGETTSAQFTFTQEETDIYEPLEQQPYHVTINPDPRILTLVLDNKAKYDIVVAGEHSDGVVCNDYGMITLPANGYVIVQFVGIPGDLTFQISEGAEYSAVSVAENTDKTNAETWSEITKSQMEDKWQFAYANSSCVKLTNTSDVEITLTNLTITENSSYKRDTYYAKAIAVVSPAQAGEVAAKGNYLNTNLENEKLFTSYSPFASTATAYSLAVSEMTLLNDQLAFSFQAQSNPGYYFLEWSPLGNPMITGDLSWADVYHNYEVSLTTAASDKSIAYSFDTYINLFCQQNQEICSAAKPESGEPNPEAVAYMNAGALALIPATNVGTWQANFALAQVESTNDVNFSEVTSPFEADVMQDKVIFNILGDDLNDFVPTIDSDNGFSFTNDDLALSLSNKTYTVSVTYTPQDVHGTHTANLTLARADVDGQPAQSKTAKLTVEENLTPSFQLSNTDFGSGTLGQETIIDILPTDKNTVAQLPNPSKLHWEASLSAGAPFEIISVADDGTCRVRYFRTESEGKSATLTIKATYTDSKGTEIPFATTCTLTGSSTEEKAVNTLALKQGIVLYVDDEPISPFSNLDANNTEGITISLPNGCTALQVEDGMIKPSGSFTTGTFEITVEQDENDYFLASGSLTTTVTVKKHTPEVIWNWSTLYFGQTYDTPITTNSDGSLTISALDDKNIVHYDDNTKTLSVEPLTEGEYEVDFSVVIAESDIYEGYEATHSATIYKDPRHLRVDVNEALTYRSVTIADQTGNNVSFADGGIHFADVAGSEYKSRQWTMYFIGVPDQLFFTPSGNNAWEIRESSDGSSWRTTFASSKLAAGEQFAMSLSPNTTHVRIVYATNADAPSNGVLNSFYITALEGVKANVDGLYMPIAADVGNNPTTKQVVLQYTSQEKLTISTSDPQFTVDVAELPAVAVDTYGEKTILVTSKATTEKEGRIYVKNAAGDILLELPIYTFIFPQTLPIQLATDEPQRFYYVTTASNYAKWDMNTRVVTLQNAPADKIRSLTFEFDGAPTLLRYNHTAGDRGTWTIRESANNADWYKADPATRVVNGNEIEQGLLTTTRYVQLQYESPYSEKVEVSNLIIVGDASVTTDVNVLEFTETQPTSSLKVTAINLADFDVQIDNKNFTVTSFDRDALTGNGIVEVPVSITWAATKAVEYATLTIFNPNDDNAVLATVELVGKKQSISGPTHIGIYTGLAENITKLNGTFEGTERRPVDLTNAFDAATQTKALFDYLLIYGETSTMDGSTIITTPTNQRGSNAKTPCYIYQREGDTYKLLKVVDNVNDQDKAWSGAIPVPVSNIPTRVYITGFAPYASTGYTKEEEGVWCFRGQAGSKLDVYLEDSYIYSRYKTIDGHSFIDRDNGESFAEQYARGSGGVLVFECSSVGNKDNPFKVNIHTMDRNLLKSHYGCFLSSMVGRAFQVSSPIQVHLINSDITATTHLSFDDIWPTAITRTTTDGVVTAEEVVTKRTNGFISLQKQVNNAPSIDMGSPETVVNFNGGQVELQNAQNVSDNYKTTLAISYRGGKFAGYFLAHGVGSDEVTGTVNFNDGTTTVIPMTVDERYRQYYLMDEDEHGNELNITSCLRCPQNTYVYGGSHCMMRACNEPTSKGGAPWSHAGEGAVRLGMYKYPYASYITGEGGDAVTHAGGWTVIEGGNGLVSIPDAYVPNIKVGDQVARQYGVASVMPNDNGTPVVAEDDYLNFWVPAGYDDSVTPEVDLKVSYWKAAMTRIKAQYASYGGEVGGDVKIGDDSDVETELVYNFLYCALDNDIKDVISKTEVINGQEVHSYAAPVKHPAAQGYLEIRPSYVSDSAVHYVKNLKPYKVQNRVYYITPIPSADNWMTFTAPFDVENLYVVETYDEKALSTLGNKTKAEIKIAQARHNADFAAFFGVALALGSDRDFEDIYSDYIGWARLQDVGKYEGTYNLRGKHAMEYYDGTNWSTANYYIYENQGTWEINANREFTTHWTLPNTEDNILMNKGNTYSLLFPFCTGCWEYDEDGMLVERTMWDYWSGKFLIFESTLRSEDNPHELDGVNTVQNHIATYTPSVGTAHVLGNTSFGNLQLSNDYLYKYESNDPLYEKFKPVGNTTTVIQPTNTFVLANITAPIGQKVVSINRDGKINYGPDNGDGNTTGTHMPTVGGGNELFITAINGGINVAVAYPQHVRVLSATGAVIYSGMVQTAVDVNLPTDGIYIVSGEREVQKILY